jgi:hypothetical protein
MKPKPNSNALGIPTPPPESYRVYADLICKTTDQIRRRFAAPDHTIDSEADHIIYQAFLHLPLDEWKAKFSRAAKSAIQFSTTPERSWKTIAAGLSDPEVAEAYKKLTPSQVKKPFSLKIATRLCADWRLDPRWEKLFPSSKELLYRLIFRTYRKDTIRKLKQALANGETFFPWCCTGIASLSKQLTYQPRSSTGMKHYKHRQIRNALRQLWDLGFLHRIFRGYKEQGAGKYHIFLNPKMSATFNQARVKTKQGATPKKKRSRMS